MSLFPDNDCLAMVVLNAIAKVAYIDTASGGLLDKWGAVKGVFRLKGETDFDYRSRIIDAISSKT